MIEEQKTSSSFSLNEYRLQRISESSIDDLIQLFQICFDTKPKRTTLINKHRYCHGENHFIGYIAYTNENSPAAFYGVFPQLLVNNNTEILFAQSGDTMTHPDHQKKGLFIKLAELTFDLCKEIGIKGIFGFPNKNSYPGFVNRLNFKETDPLYSLTFLENRIGYSRFLKSSMSESWSVFLANFVFRKGQLFENSSTTSHNSEISFLKHDDLFFKVKDKFNVILINIFKTNVLIKINQNALIIGDIQSTDLYTYKKIIRRLKKFCFFSGLRFLTVDCSKNSFLYAQLNTLAKAENESFKSIINLFSQEYPIKNISFLGCDIDIY
jgi:hypothetical protein